MVVAVLSVQYLGLSLGDVVLLLQAFDDEIFDGDFGLDFFAQADRPASRESSRTRLLFGRISNNIELVGDVTDESSSGVVGADIVRSDRMASAMALTLVSDKSKIVY
jgi:hypothetical protein